MWGAPKLRELLDLLDEISRDARLPAHKRKVMVMCQAPKTAEVIYTLLRYLGISTALLASDTRARDRETIIERFNETAHIDVLITCFSLDIAGHDCHRRCARAIIVEPAFNWATELPPKSGAPPSVLCRCEAVVDHYVFSCSSAILDFRKLG